MKEIDAVFLGYKNIRKSYDKSYDRNVTAKGKNASSSYILNLSSCRYIVVYSKIVWCKLECNYRKYSSNLG